MIKLLCRTINPRVVNRRDFGTSAVEQEMLFCYIKTIPGQIRNPPLKVLEGHLVCHDRQNLSSSAPSSSIVTTFGKAFHQGGVDCLVFKLWLSKYGM